MERPLGERVAPPALSSSVRPGLGATHVSEEDLRWLQPWASYECDSMVDFPGGPVVGSLPASVRDTGSIPGPGGSHMQLVCLELRHCNEE